MSAATTTRAERKDAWEQKRRVTHKRLRDAARMARWVAATPLGLLFLAMVATMFGLINDPLPIYKGITILMVVPVALAVIGGCGRAGARVWHDAADDKKVRVHLVVAPLVTLVLALCGYGLATGMIKLALHRAFNFSFNGALLLIAIIAALMLYVLVLWLLITLSLGVVRRLSMAIQASDAPPADDSDEDDESEAKSPGSSRFAHIYVLAWFTWLLWLAFASIVLI